MQPIRQNFIKKQATAEYNSSMAIGSLKSLSTNIECIRCDVTHMIIIAIGGIYKFKIKNH